MLGLNINNFAADTPSGSSLTNRLPEVYKIVTALRRTSDQIICARAFNHLIKQSRSSWTNHLSRKDASNLTSCFLYQSVILYQASSKQQEKRKKVLQIKIQKLIRKPLI